MKYFSYTILLLSMIFFYSCGSKDQNKETVEIVKVPAEIPELDDFDYDTLTGMYEGDFGKSPIRIVLNYVSGSNAIGYNLHKGLQRNLTGKVNRIGDTVTIVLNEPGDHEYDGVFTLTFIGVDKKPSGTWVHNEGWVPTKHFELSKYEMKEPEGDEIVASNFTNYFDMVFDSLGTYYFSSDGLVRYEYYPYKDEDSRVEQLKEVKGSWFLTDSLLRIDWQKNTRFKNPTQNFVVSFSDWGGPMIKGEGLELYPMFW